MAMRCLCSKVLGNLCQPSHPRSQSSVALKEGNVITILVFVAFTSPFLALPNLIGKKGQIRSIYNDDNKVDEVLAMDKHFRVDYASSTEESRLKGADAVMRKLNELGFLAENMTSKVPGTLGQQFNNDAIPSYRFYEDKRVLNISVQTGEEFSPEFLRDRVTPRKDPFVNDINHHQQKKVEFNINQNQQLVYEDLSGLLGIRRNDSESGTFLSDFSPAEGYAREVENKAYPDFISQYHQGYSPVGQQPWTYLDEYKSDRIAHKSDSPHSNQSYGHGSRVSDGSFSGKMKFLCSFGGRILPRPSDGKLRYVGGETRIISIRKTLAYSELEKKTYSICSQPHTIKYQLPGEDLDALISVSSDEDLDHMIEEYHDLERGSQRLRIFLVSSTDPESPCSLESRTVQPTDADYQYVVALNGMMNPSPRRSSSRESLTSQASQWGNALDSPTFQRDFPTFHPLNMRMLSNPTAHFINKPHTENKSNIQSPPLSPVPVQLKDPKGSHMKGHDDPAMDQLANENSYFYKHPLDAVPVVNNLHEDRHLIERNHLEESHLHRCRSSRDFLSSPLYGQGDLDYKNPTVDGYPSHYEKFPSSQATMGLFFGDDIPGVSRHRISRALSDSQLQLEERHTRGLEYGITLSPVNLEAEKSPSLAMSSSSQEWTMQRNMGENDNHPTSIAPEVSKDYIDWGQNVIKKMENKDLHLPQDKEDHDGIDDVESKTDLPSILNYPYSRPNIHISPQAINSNLYGGNESSWSLFENDPLKDLSMPGPAIDAALTREFSLQEDDSQQSPEKKSWEGLKFRNAIYVQSQPSNNPDDPELTVIVEDVTDSVPLDIPSSSTVVPFIQDEPSDGVSSPRETENESMVPESDDGVT
ncbi:hypothetical protein RJ639_045956 [Escallonia herrerae]|uniref:PB1 domain-containing protein n=1 Tax=Escallonia herrerae TaxID=1293975 RepID=A0AA88W875_9ASTE|nr:hypothetical protein RJ639_045956 [Escallonia herrerae]